MRSMCARTTLVPTLVAAMLAAGCGGGDGGGGAVNPASSPAVDDAVSKCLDQAKTIKPADARKTAEAACNSAKTGDVGKVKNAAKQQCLNAVKQIPDSQMAQKDAAKARCDAIK
jgi:hypothetical protein